MNRFTLWIINLIVEITAVTVEWLDIWGNQDKEPITINATSYVSQYQSIDFYKAQGYNELLSTELTISIVIFWSYCNIGTKLKHCPTNNKDKDIDYVKVPNHKVFLSSLSVYSFVDSFINIVNNYLQWVKHLLRTM